MVAIDSGNNTRKLLVFDGCAGSKSATKAFSDRGHIVETLDIEGDHTYTTDIREFHPGKEYDFMWFSPPCTEFSKAAWRLGKCRQRKPDLSIVQACFKIIKESDPTYWIIENPVGCMRYFIGPPEITINYSDYGHACKKPTALWGRFPWFWSSVQSNNKTILFKDAFPKKNDIARSKIPYELSLAICKAVENG